MAVINMPIEYLVPHPQNPRKELGDLTELVESIKANGIYQNLTVVPIEENNPEKDPEYMVLIGHRRLAAAKLAGLKEVPCAIARDAYTETKQLQIMLMENMQRSDLTVYEQAQGFQQLLDFGVDLDTISEQSGFSKATIRRRLKIAELDQQKLKKISDERQLNLGDFEVLSRVESLAKRNEILDSIGTNDFRFKVNSAIIQEAIQKNKPLFQTEMKRLQAKSMKVQDRWSGKFKELGTFYISEWDNWKDKIPASKNSLYYYNDHRDAVEFYERKAKEPKQKEAVAPEVLAKEQKISQANALVREMSREHYQLRSEFIARLHPAKNNVYVYTGAYIAGIMLGLNYQSIDAKGLMQMLGLPTDRYTYEAEKVPAVLSFLDKATGKDDVQAVYYLFGDSKENYFADIMKGRYPKYRQNSKLIALYIWLKKLGYKMCEEEIQMLNGTHHVFEQDVFEKKK